MTFSKTVQCPRHSNFPFMAFTGKQMIRPDEFNPVNNFPTQSQVMFHCLKKKSKGKKIFLVFLPVAWSSEELFLCQRLDILSFRLIACLVARMGSKGNSHHKFTGWKLAPGMSFLEVCNGHADLVTWINNKNLWQPCSKIQDRSSWLNVHVYCLL